MTRTQPDNAPKQERHIPNAKDMRCCGNCLWRESIPYAGSFSKEDCTNEAHHITRGSWTACDKWEYDEVDKFTRRQGY